MRAIRRSKHRNRPVGGSTKVRHDLRREVFANPKRKPARTTHGLKDDGAGTALVCASLVPRRHVYRTHAHATLRHEREVLQRRQGVVHASPETAIHDDVGRPLLQGVVQGKLEVALVLDGGVHKGALGNKPQRIEVAEDDIGYDPGFLHIDKSRVYRDDALEGACCDTGRKILRRKRRSTYHRVGRHAYLPCSLITQSQKRQSPLRGASDFLCVAPPTSFVRRHQSSLVLEYHARAGQTVACSDARGKSGLLRAGCQLTAGRGDPTE